MHSFNQMRKIVVNLGSDKGEKNDNFSTQLTHIHNSLLMSISNSPKNYLSNVDRKSDMRKVRTYEVKSLSTLFSCSIRAMYNMVNRDQK